jgi:hypothetical protein
MKELSILMNGGKVENLCWNTAERMIFAAQFFMAGLNNKKKEKSQRDSFC